MKLRPHFDLRFRDAEQFESVRGQADRAGLSMNEWVLRKVEASGVQAKAFNPAAKVQELVPPGEQSSLAHDPKTCRIYKCGMCAAIKGEQ